MEKVKVCGMQPACSIPLLLDMNLTAIYNLFLFRVMGAGGSNGTQSSMQSLRAQVY